MNKNQTMLVMEGVWWVITAVVVLVVFLPIQQANVPWPFWGWNTLFIVVLITLSRYIFLMRYTFLADRQIIKAILFIAMFPILFAVIGGVNGFMTYIEDNTWDPITGHLASEDKRGMESYLWNEMLFFGTGSVIVVPAFSIWLFISVWRQYNAKRRK
jgi:FlaA1/EpsC-like NDP-sugar epimerase